MTMTRAQARRAWDAYQALEIEQRQVRAQFAATFRGMMRDWNAATLEQRATAIQKAAAAAESA